MRNVHKPPDIEEEMPPVEEQLSVLATKTAPQTADWRKDVAREEGSPGTSRMRVAFTRRN